ncbi:MAG TPA: hypothetical protein VFP37_16680 [Steroidobacteraceae bacterium]|nr:hypothetical protein [Steroidobacteraceae bacterium]
MRWRRLVAGLLLGVVALALLVVAINRPWFDEALMPELVALRDSKVEFSGDNAYAEIAALRKSDSPLAALPSLECVARRYLDCASRLIAESASTHWQTPDVVQRLERYDVLLRHAHYVETRAAGAGAPVVPNLSILNLGQLRLALSYQHDTTPDFLEKAADDFGFWTTVLREGESLQAKMVALGAIQNDLDFISTRMRERPLESAELQFVQDFLHPFTPEEADVGAGILSELRIELLLGEPYVAMDSPWWMRLLLQKNATLNLGYREIIAPVVARAALSARQFYATRGYEPIHHELHATPRSLFNLGGRLAWARSTWDPWEFPSRVHDLDARISMVLLQAEIAQRPGAEPGAVIRESTHRNPYTGEAFEYDARAGIISFQCVEKAYHPPDPPPLCAVAIQRPVN